MERQPSENAQPTKVISGKKRKLYGFLMLLFVLLAVGLALNLFVFRVSDMRIQLEFDVRNNPAGDMPMSADEIRSALGITSAPSYFSFSEESLTKSINQYNSISDQQYFLKLESFDKSAPSHANIVVKQRQKVARIRGPEGNVYCIDEDGVVLENRAVNDIRDEVHPELILLADMNATFPRRNGNAIKPSSAKKLETYSLIISQMLDLDILYDRNPLKNEIMLAYKDMRIANGDSVTLTTYDGYTVVIYLSEGEPVNELRAKLRTMVIIMDDIRKDPSVTGTTGTIKIKIAGEATFTPQ